MGLPIERLVVASNRNDILTRFFSTGTMAITEVVPTTSPSMDIQVSSNLERLLFEVLGNDVATLSPARRRELRRDLERPRRIGGAPYLHTLISTVPTAANAGFYAEIVAEKAILRRLVEAGTRIVQFGYAGGEGQDVAEVVDRAQAEVYDVTERRTSEDYIPLEQLLQPTMDELDAIASRGGISLGVPTGFADLDKLTNGLHPGQMIVVAARPAMGKSTVGLDLARCASIKHKLTSAIFSLEMSRNEIVMRLLSAEAGISLQHMRGAADHQQLASDHGPLLSAHDPHVRSPLTALRALSVATARTGSSGSAT